MTSHSHTDSAAAPGALAGTLRFLKAHATENDFVILDDPGVTLDLDSPEAGLPLVRELCDRRAGIGGDGLIRIARAGALRDAGVLRGLPSGVAEDDWFMDYRNADGSIAEMCGNGARAFGHALVDLGYATAGGEDTLRIGTRAGAQGLRLHSADARDAQVSVVLNAPRILGHSTATLSSGQEVRGLGVDMGNPHLAAVIPGLTPDALRALPIEQPCRTDAEFFPEGVNVEILTPLADAGSDPIHMRVHERGCGETRSCGTGTVAAVTAALTAAGRESGTVRVIVPGGEVTVSVDLRSGEGATLTGPSRIVAHGDYLLGS